VHFLLTGLSIHTFHGNFFVRSTDLLSLPNINPDAGFGVQVSIEDTLDMNYISFQAALLYTSSKGRLLHCLIPHTASQKTVPPVIFSKNFQLVFAIIGNFWYRYKMIALKKWVFSKDDILIIKNWYEVKSYSS